MGRQWGGGGGSDRRQPGIQGDFPEDLRPSNNTYTHIENLSFSNGNPLVGNNAFLLKTLIGFGI